MTPPFSFLFPQHKVSFSIMKLNPISFADRPILHFLFGIIILGGIYNILAFIPSTPFVGYLTTWLVYGTFLTIQFRLIEKFSPRPWMVNYGAMAGLWITIAASKVMGLHVGLPWIALLAFSAASAVVIALEDVFSDRHVSPPPKPGMRVAIDGKIMAGVVLKIKHCDGISPLFWYIGKDGIVTKISNGGMLVPYDIKSAAIVPFYTSGKQQNVDYAEEVASATENVDFQVTP